MLYKNVIDSYIATELECNSNVVIGILAYYKGRIVCGRRFDIL